MVFIKGAMLQYVLGSAAITGFGVMQAMLIQPLVQVKLPGIKPVVALRLVRDRQVACQFLQQCLVILFWILRRLHDITHPVRPFRCIGPFLRQSTIQLAHPGRIEVGRVNVNLVVRKE